MKWYTYDTHRNIKLLWLEVFLNQGVSPILASVCPDFTVIAGSVEIKKHLSKWPSSNERSLANRSIVLQVFFS